ncbi:MAG TPA: hypothetical protein VK791_11215 [bacterium]|jgi:hypothetical protein|nr:hypothetical protein [bacterium]
MKIISLDNLSQADPDNECFIIKSVFKPVECEEIIQWISSFLTSVQENEKFNGENWHYHILKDGIDFQTFNFYDLKKLGNEKLTHFYKTLFNLYQKFGECSGLDFETEIARSNQTGKTINPQTFWYPAGVGKFKWHEHPGDFQRFQLLCNLTRPNIDYRGGETLIDMGSSVETFAADFEQGDVFSFPYTKRHMVNAVEKGSGDSNRRISLLMPLLPRAGVAGVKY